MKLRRVYFTSLLLVIVIFLSSFVMEYLRAPNLSEIRARFPSSDLILTSADGGLLTSRRLDRNFKGSTWIALSECSPELVDAIVRTEDRRFYRHFGVDLIALSRAAFKSFSGGPVQGGGTISMQLYRLLNKRSGERSKYVRKYWEIIGAVALEAKMSKQEILESYLNLVPLRGELVGVGAGSQGLFGRLPETITKYQSELIARLLRSPNRDINQVSRETCDVAEEVELDLCAAELSSIYSPSLIKEQMPDFSPGLIDFVRDRSTQGVRGLFTTSIDHNLQERVVQIAKSRVLQLGSQNVHDAAALVMENETGKILAWLGNLVEGSTARYVDGVLAKRSAGSTLKPFLYALAFEQGVIDQETLIDDSPLNLVLDRGSYRPMNYDRKFRGAVPARIALASSLNIPAVRVLQLVGLERFHAVLSLLSLGTSGSAERFGFSMALGAPSVSLLNLTNSYRMLAQRGDYSDVTISLLESAERKSSRIFSNRAAELVTAILADRDSRSETFGLESPLNTPFWSAVKTGTSRDMVDNWCVGFTDRYTVGVWVGNLSGSPMYEVSGVSGAAPIWNEIISTLPRSESRAAVELTKTPQEDLAAPTSPLISHPTNGMVFAIDSDIPEDSQRVRLLSSVRSPDVLWRSKGILLGATDIDTFLSLTVGETVIELVDNRSNILDRVKILVK